MKTNNMKKIVVSTLGLVMGASLVGSISGSVAWYQYSTRAAASMTATSAGTSRNLQITNDAGSHWLNYIGGLNGNIQPITVGNTTAADATSLSFYDKPVYQHADSGKELTSIAGYALQYTFNFRVMDAIDGAEAAPQADKPVYLQDITIAAADSSDANAVKLAKAVRVHIAGNDGTSAVGGIFAADVTSTALHGQLDIGGAAGVMDTDGLDMTDTSGSAIEYGKSNTAVLSSYSAEADKTAHTFLADDSDPYNISTGVQIATTTASSSNNVVVTVWLEGWGLVNGSASWDYATYISKNVKIDMRFCTIAE